MADANTWTKRIDDWLALYAKKKATHKTITDYYSHEFPSSVIPVNLIFSFGRAMVPQLYFKNPVVAVTIERPGFDDAAALLQKVDDKLLRLTQVKKTIKKMITMAYCYGRGPAKCGFNSEPDVTVRTGLFGAVPFKGPLWKLRKMIGPNRPWFLPFYPDDFAFDALVSDFEDSAWNAMRFERSARQLEDDDYLAPLMKGVDKSNDPDFMYEFWEIWDQYEGKFLYLRDGKITEGGDIEVWPFHQLEFNWNPRNPVPISDAELILKLQEEYNEIKTQIHEHRRISVLKIIARKNAFDREAKAKMEGGKVGPLVEVDGNPAEIVQPFAPQIPEALYTVANTTLDDVRDSIGYTRNQLGEFQPPTRGRTAREATIVQQAIMLRLDERRDMVADLIQDVITTYNDYIIGTWKTTDVEKYVGNPAGWEKLGEVKGEFTVSVVPDSTLPVGRQVKQAEAKEMYLTLRGDPLIDQVRLRLRYLQSFESADESLINPLGAAGVSISGNQPEAIQGAQGTLGGTQQLLGQG
jgi:hypothetical protein